MQPPLHVIPPLLLAQVDQTPPVPGGFKLSQVSEHFSSDSMIPTHWLLIAAGGMLLLLSGLSIARWYKHRDEYSNPLLVYLGVSRLVGLSYRDQWLLMRIARNGSLVSPLTLMLSPATFQHHAQPYINTRSTHRQQALKRRTQALHDTLFADDPDHGDPQAPQDVSPAQS